MISYFKISSRSGMIQCHAKVRLLPRVLLFLGQFLTIRSVSRFLLGWIMGNLTSCD